MYGIDNIYKWTFQYANTVQVSMLLFLFAYWIHGYSTLLLFYSFQKEVKDYSQYIIQESEIEMTESDKLLENTRITTREFPSKQYLSFSKLYTNTHYVLLYILLVIQIQWLILFYNLTLFPVLLTVQIIFGILFFLIALMIWNSEPYNFLNVWTSLRSTSIQMCFSVYFLFYIISILVCKNELTNTSPFFYTNGDFSPFVYVNTIHSLFLGIWVIVFACSWFHLFK